VSPELPTKPRTHTAQNIEELIAIAVSLENLRTRIATTRDVIDSIIRWLHKVVPYVAIPLTGLCLYLQ
jgi:hypothetical protein